VNPCLLYTEASCTAAGVCRWDPYARGTDDDPFCVPNDCPFNSTDCASAGVLKPGCMWSPFTNQCIFDPCRVVPSNSTCRLLDGCDWGKSCYAVTGTASQSRIPPATTTQTVSKTTTLTITTTATVSSTEDTATVSLTTSGSESDSESKTRSIETDGPTRTSSRTVTRLLHTPSLHRINRSSTPEIAPLIPSDRVYPVDVAVKGLESAAAMATVALGAVQPSVATLAGRQNAIRSLIACSSGFDPAVQPPDHDINPFQWAISVGVGSDADAVLAADLHAGAVAFGSTLFFGFSLLVLAVATVNARFQHSRQVTKERKITHLRRGFALTRFPGITAFVYAYTSGIVAQSAVIVVFSPVTTTAARVAMALVGLLITAPAAIGCWAFRRWFRRIFVASPHVTDGPDGPDASAEATVEGCERGTEDEEQLLAQAAPKARKNFVRFWDYWFEDCDKWSPSASIDSAVGADLLRQYHSLFDGLTDRAPWFLAADLILLGLAGGIASRLAIVMGCTAGAWVLFTVYVSYLALLAIFRPFSARVEFIGVGLVSGSQTMSVLLAAVQASYGRSFENVATAAELVSTGASLLLTFFTIACAAANGKAFLDTRAREKKAKSAVQPTRSDVRVLEVPEIEAPLLVAPLKAVPEQPSSDGSQQVSDDDVNNTDNDDPQMVDPPMKSSPQPSAFDLLLATVAPSAASPSTNSAAIVSTPYLPDPSASQAPEIEPVAPREYVNSFWHGDNPLAMYHMAPSQAGDANLEEPPSYDRLDIAFPGSQVNPPPLGEADYNLL
jgi:hypothetical protein